MVASGIAISEDGHQNQLPLAKMCIAASEQLSYNGWSCGHWWLGNLPMVIDHRAISHEVGGLMVVCSLIISLLAIDPTSLRCPSPPITGIEGSRERPFVRL